mmetsp:Transcript_129011/g.248598  ORF Transcript_129011/g.248598 Transcript_129011/m.248598 type:complete len:308 (-) Transcript_129011:31-954(-)
MSPTCRQCSGILLVFVAVGFGQSPSWSSKSHGCLCAFDIHRTLSTKQGAVAHCPGSRQFDGAEDYSWRASAKDPAALILSDAGQHLNQTFCRDCYLAIITCGDYSEQNDAGWHAMDVAMKSGSKIAAKWKLSQRGFKIQSPYVMEYCDKPEGVRAIKDWYASQSVTILDADVYYFDDEPRYIKDFVASPYNARQVSCGSRDCNALSEHYCPARTCPDCGTCSDCHNICEKNKNNCYCYCGTGPNVTYIHEVGFCGATVDEIVPSQGVVFCPVESEPAVEEMHSSKTCSEKQTSGCQTVWEKYPRLFA